MKRQRGRERERKKQFTFAFDHSKMINVVVIVVAAVVTVYSSEKIREKPSSHQKNLELEFPNDETCAPITNFDSLCRNIYMERSQSVQRLNTCRRERIMDELKSIFVRGIFVCRPGALNNTT